MFLNISDAVANGVKTLRAHSDLRRTEFVEFKCLRKEFSKTYFLNFRAQSSTGVHKNEERLSVCNECLSDHLCRKTERLKKNLKIIEFGLGSNQQQNRNLYHCRRQHDLCPSANDSG